MTRAGVVWVWLAVLAATGPREVSAQAYGDWVSPADKPRAFLGLSVFQDGPGGEFDGKYVLGDPTYAFFFPQLDGGAGLHLYGGGVLKGGIWSVGYFQSGHRARFQGMERTAGIHGIEVEGRGFLIREKPVRPYLQAGFTIPWVTVKAGCTVNGIARDALYMGLGAKLGVGLAAEVAPNLLLAAGAHYRYLALLYVKGGKESRDVANFYVDRFGPKRRSFIKVPTPG
ncbi:MAG: hypothetical protein JW742_01670, partial [Candidatus Aminicenantes bacterium]|nr:hypothetical protein [Candidatus Aminicenantes bacterium]